MKKNLKARVISFFMSFAMLFQILPITVLAAMNPPTIDSVGGINVDQETNMGGAPTVIKGQAYSAQVVATGAELTYTAGVGSYMTLPAGLTINSENGLISGNCTAENGRYDVYIEVSNATGKAHAIVGFTVGDSSLAPVITTEAGSLGTTYKDAYNYFMVSIDNENGVASDIYGFNWSLVSGSLPDGMSLLYTNKPTVHISGTPTGTGTFTFELKAKNDFGSVSREFSISVEEGEVKPNIIRPNADGNLEVGVIGQSYEYQLQATGTNTQENPILWSIDDDDFTQESGDLGKGLSISKTGLITGTPKEAGTIGFNVYAKNSEGIDSDYLYFNIYDNGEATSISVTPEVVVIERGSSKEFNVSLEGYGDVEQEAYWGFYMWDDDLGSAFPMPTNSELNVDGNTPSGNVTLTVGENEETQQFRVVAYSKSGNNGVRAYATVMVDADYKFITQPQTKKLAVGGHFYPAWELNFVPDEVIIEYDNEGVWSIWNTANATGGTILPQDNPLTLRVKASKNGLSIYSEEFQASWEDNYEFSVTPNTIEWGNVDWTGSYTEKTATIENIGTKTFYIECSTNDEFNISIDNGNLALAPGAQTTLHITPKQSISAGNHNFNLTLKSTDGDDKWSMNLPVSINVVAPTFTTVPQGGTVPVDSTHTVNFALDKEPDSIALQWYNDYSSAWAPVIGVELESNATSATVPAEDSAQTKQYRILATYGINTISSEFELKWEEPAPTTYLITLIGHDITNTSTAGGKLYLETDEGLALDNGTLYVTGHATENTDVIISAEAADGYEFVEWRLSSPTGSTVTTNANHTFTATENLYLYAIFQEESVQPTTYTVTVTKGTASPTSAAEGATVTITANAPEQGKEFDKWLVNAGGVTLADATASETTFTMGTANVEVEATYKDIAPIGNIVIPEFAKQEEGYSDLEYKGVSVTITNNGKIDPAKTSVVLGGLRPGDFEYILNQNHGFMSGPGTWDTLLSVRPKTGLGAGLSKATITLKYDYDSDEEYETTIGSGEISFGVSAKTYTVTVTKGTASVEKAKEGIEVTITADTPEQGKEFDKWVVNAGGVSLADATASETTFTMGTANVEVEATYKDIAPIGNIVIPEFETKEAGYSDLEYKGVSVTITNNGKIDPAKTSVVLGGLRPGDFEYILNQNHGFMSGSGTWDTLLSVRPKTGLGAGLSKATITLKYDYDGDGEYETTIGSGEISFGVSAKTYTVTVTKGTASVEKAKEGIEVTITADTPEQGKEFDKWVVNAGGVSLADATASETTFTMGTSNVEVEATYKEPQPQLQPITAIDVTCPGYIIGGNIANAVPTTATQGVTITYYEWQENDNGSKLESGTFAADTQYRLAVYLNVNDGYTAENLEKANVKIDGKETSYFTNPCLGSDAQIGDMKIYHYPDMLSQKYTVTFNSNGGSAVAAIENVTSGEKISKPTDPTKDEYTFGGWYKETELTNEFNFATDTITGDTTLYAKWEAVVPATITTISVGNVDMPEVGESSDDLTNNPATLTYGDSYQMAGFGIKVKNGDSWDDYNGEENVIEAGKTYRVEITLMATSEKLFDSGITDANITVNGEAGKLVEFYNNYQMVKISKEFSYAAPATYTVTFNSNGGSAVAAIENVTSGEKISKPTDPTRTGYTFAGWYKDAELTKEFNFATDTITENTTLYAKWNTNQTSGGGGGGGSTTTKYTITVKQNDNGKISPETTKVEKGDNQKFEITADKGYEVEKVLVDGKSVGAVTEYTFEKVKEKHTIEATFKKVEEVTEETWKNPFTDVTEDDWFYEAVKYANENKLFNGVSSTEFGPNVSMTRAMLVTVLYRLEGEPATNRSIPFADVDMSIYYANAVIWAKQNNIVNGVDETNFAPNLEVTREQLVTILYRYAQYKGKDVSVGENTNILSYDDFSELSEYAIPAMQWACGSGIITGRTTSTIAPKGTATRAEVATMLMRFVK